MEELLADPRVEVAYADQCQFGLTAKVRSFSEERGPAKKPTGFVGNSWAILRRLRRTCDHSHEHVKLEGGRAKNAALYPDELCKEVCLGLKDQIEYDNKGLKCLGSLDEKELKQMVDDMVDTAEEFAKDSHGSEEASNHLTDEAGPKPISQRKVRWSDEVDDTEEELMTMATTKERGDRYEAWPANWKDMIHDEDGGMDMFGRRPQNGTATLRHELSKLAFSDGVEWAQDDVSGVNLDPSMMRKAREVEMTFFRKMGVYTRVPRSTVQGGKIIKTRWVDVNKGDSEKSDYRSRLVGMEFNTGKNDELYASTPPWRPSGSSSHTRPPTPSAAFRDTSW